MAANIKGVGTRLHNIPSGKGIQDVWWKFVVTAYKKHLGAVRKLHFIANLDR